MQQIVSQSLIKQVLFLSLVAYLFSPSCSVNASTGPEETVKSMIEAMDSGNLASIADHVHWVSVVSTLPPHNLNKLLSVSTQMPSPGDLEARFRSFFKNPDKYFEDTIIPRIEAASGKGALSGEWFYRQSPDDVRKRYEHMRKVVQIKTASYARARILKSFEFDNLAIVELEREITEPTGFEKKGIVRERVVLERFGEVWKISTFAPMLKSGINEEVLADLASGGYSHISVNDSSSTDVFQIRWTGGGCGNHNSYRVFRNDEKRETIVLVSARQYGLCSMLLSEVGSIPWAAIGWRYQVSVLTLNMRDIFMFFSEVLYWL